MKPIMSFLIAFLFFQLLSINVSFCNGSTYVGCMEAERKALLMFKQGLTNTSNRLDSWVGDGDCCKWVGVVCDNLTGHVLELRLGNPHAECRILDEYTTPRNEATAICDAYSRSGMGGKLNPSLLDLKHLDYLDLSHNFFEGIRIPEFLGSMESLTYLNLSDAGFSGMIPHQLGNLSNLRYLDLSCNYYSTSAGNLFWLSSLPLLEHLDLSGVNLSRASSWLLEINTLPSLKVLKLSSCELQHFPPLSIVNFSSLITLDLFGNYHSMIPSWVFGFSHLLFLDMSVNFIYGPIPNGIQNLTFLRHLDLSINYFNTSIPAWMYRFTHLEYLSLGHNNLQGMISDAIANLTFIEILDLSYNYKLERRISSSFGQLCNLRSIDFTYIKLSQAISEILNVFLPCISDKLESLSLSSTQVFGTLPYHQFGQFKNLRILNLGNNSIVGPISPSLGKLRSLKFLDVSLNKLNETLSQIHFKNLKELLVFDISENSLTLTINPGWTPPFQLNYLSLSSCHLGPRFPSWIYSQKFLSQLDISYSGISDTIGNQFWKSLPQLVYLDISHNHIHGKIPYFLKGNDFYFLDMSSNNLSGPLPLIYPLFGLDLSNNNFSGSISHFVCHRMHKPKQIQFLKLRGNFLSGELPDCWMIWPSLQILDLGNNKFTGNLPLSMGTLSELEWLRLRKNNLSGTIPASLGNCTKLGTLDIGENELVGTIPTWMGDRLSSIMILNLRSNKFHGHLPRELCNLASLQIMDLAQNNFFGPIPRCINNISAMVTMNYRVQNGVTVTMNYFPIPYGVRHFTNYTSAVEDASLVMKGQTVEYSTILNLVRSIDLSENNFSGDFPIEVTHLEALQSLNLSYNSFIGRIPENIGAMRLLESADFSSNKLSGEIPQSISNLTFLSHLNLSNNNLVGKIPLSTQLQSLDASSFIGNELCGAPLPKDCTKTSPTPDPKNGGGKDDKEHEVDWFYVGMALGFAVGFWSLIGPLLANRRWRYTYSCFLDRLGFIVVDVVRKYF